MPSGTRAPRLRREIHRFNEELKRKNFPGARSEKIATSRSGSRAKRHPRATATATTVKYSASAPTETVGLRPLWGAMPPTWLSARRGSIRSILNTVRTVFRCVASRNSVARDLVGLFSADVSRPSGLQNALWARHHSSPGNRGYDEGMLMNVGSAGYSCSSGTSGIDVRFLHFHTGAEIYPHNSGHRAHGFPLRCLQEQVERQRLRNTDRESSARRPPPRGALRLGDEAGDAKHRETDPPSFRKIRPRARPPAPAYGGRCAPRPRDAKHRDKFGKTSQPRTQSRSHYDV